MPGSRRFHFLHYTRPACRVTRVKSGTQVDIILSKLSQHASLFELDYHDGPLRVRPAAGLILGKAVTGAIQSSLFLLATHSGKA